MRVLPALIKQTGARRDARIDIRCYIDTDKFIVASGDVWPESRCQQDG